MANEYRVKITEVESELGKRKGVKWELQKRRVSHPVPGYIFVDDEPEWEWVTEDLSTTKPEALKAAQQAKDHFVRQDKLEDDSEFIALD